MQLFTPILMGINYLDLRNNNGSLRPKNINI